MGPVGVDLDLITPRDEMTGAGPRRRAEAAESAPLESTVSASMSASGAMSTKAELAFLLVVEAFSLGRHVAAVARRGRVLPERARGLMSNHQTLGSLKRPHGEAL